MTFLHPARPARFPADAQRGANATPIAEVVRFRTVEGVSDQSLTDAARASAAAVAALPGFVSRRLIRDETGLWTDFVVWDSLQAAQDAAAQVMQMAEFGPFMAAIDVSSIEMSHQPIHLSIGG
ncbi:hypothetical protein [Gemmobacter denitrificans]|uniref:Antibiotic biosynthesis monooxygenase n=1 Tax=Gemmobacter denitrificans TaxID=3123040 RepID=A0ABU8BT71_9RHOB